MQRPELGQRVRFTHYVEKRQRQNPEKIKSGEPYNEWRIFDANRLFWDEDSFVEGIFIGKRIWSIGHKKCWETQEKDSETGHEYIEYHDAYVANEYREVWLIAFHYSRNPVAVFPEHCEIIESEVA